MCPDTGVWRPEAGTGVEVAKTLQTLGHDGAEVIIHSLHKQGARDMKIWLPKARLLPFGSFSVRSGAMKLVLPKASVLLFELDSEDQ
jgi:hypothetical protein